MDHKVIGTITARMKSTRLLGKVMHKVAGKTLFEIHVERMKAVYGLSGVFLATSEDPANKPLIEEAERLGCGWYAGAEQDVVERLIKLCEQENADAIIRITCDCPLFDIGSASRFVKEFSREYWDYIYVSNMTQIQGTVPQLISYKALKETHKYHRGVLVAKYIKENMDKMKTKGIEMEADLCRPEYRLTIDEMVDIELIGHIYKALYKGSPIELKEVYAWLDDNPEVAKINMHVGIKGCEQYSANISEKPLYSIVSSGRRYVILDAQKRKVEPTEFIHIVKKMFLASDRKETQ